MKKFIAGMVFMHYLILIGRTPFFQATVMKAIKQIKALEEETRPEAKKPAPRPDSPNEVVFETIGEANLVLRELRKIARTRGSALVCDFYDLSGVLSSYKDSKVGWTDLEDCSVLYDGVSGFTLDLPKPIEL